MTRYVVGFCFSKDKSKVALIRKVHSEQQRDRLNGIGGHIQTGESIYQTMKREFAEKAGVIFPSLSWSHKFTIVNKLIGYELNVMYVFSDAIDRIRTMSDEQVETYLVDHILSRDLDKNVSWIIPLILAADIESGFVIKDNGKI